MELGLQIFANPLQNREDGIQAQASWPASSIGEMIYDSVIELTGGADLTSSNRTD